MAEHPRLHSIPGGRDDRSPARPQEAVREPLWREVLGERLRALRQEHSETLAETAKRAGVSPQYLSEVERGRKEPSSEMIAALAGALGTSLGGLTEQVADELRRQRRLALARPAALRPGALPTLAGAPGMSPADLIEMANGRRRIVRTQPAVPERAERDRNSGPTLMASAA
ncbi:helix-turn-helix domain-containing protein [Nocardia wallacei]|uniref:helix-turn-helix domain-containing protein n=1 Tax=Nocardia wallacei TaxID=480035 RepID=UPI0024574D54|nr:helix-turn-helix transcriptional regulator [Nocardia wallacei]